MSSIGNSETNHLVLVVGYDGTEPAERALKSATEILQGAPGRMEVVFVAHVPSSVAFSAQATASVQQGMDKEEEELGQRVDQVLGQVDVKSSGGTGR